MIPTISIRELKKLIAEKGNYLLIDVREKFELAHGIIPTSHNIPLGDLPQNLAMDEKTFKQVHGFERVGKLIFYCRTGKRSEKATALALTMGYDAVSYEGSIREWSESDPDVFMY